MAEDPNIADLASADADEQTERQRRQMLASMRDVRPLDSIAALAPRNQPLDVERAVNPEPRPEVRGDTDEFKDDPLDGLQPVAPDSGTVRRTEGTEAGDKASEKVLSGDLPTPVENSTALAEKTAEAAVKGQPVKG